MSPVWMIEGTRRPDPVAQRNMAERRFLALVAAVRDHEASVRRRGPEVRPQDANLYRRMHQICDGSGA